jgi:Uma2 family endonuclease
MSTVVAGGRLVQIPSWVTDLPSFRRWLRSDEFPETGHVCFIHGEVWVDLSMEQLFTHNRVKGEVFRALENLLKQNRLGLMFSDGARVTNPEAEWSCQPDAVFVARETLEAGGVRLIDAAEEGYVEIEGSPDMVLEVVSPSTVHKDTVALKELYAKAGVREYWLVDARREQLTFTIWQLRATGYVAARKSGGWLRSTVFGKSFRLTRDKDESGHPEFNLAVR